MTDDSLEETRVKSFVIIRDIFITLDKRVSAGGCHMIVTIAYLFIMGPSESLTGDLSAAGTPPHLQNKKNNFWVPLGEMSLTCIST